MSFQKYLIAGAFGTILFSGCAPKVYKENQVYGTGVNSHYEFDVINKDKEIIHTIQRNNADFFNYRLNWGVEKMVESLTYKKDFSNDPDISSSLQNYNLKSPSDLGSSVETQTFRATQEPKNTASEPKIITNAIAPQPKGNGIVAEPKKEVNLFKDITNDYHKSNKKK